MLEIPEAAAIAAQLNESVAGLRIKQVVAAQNPHGFAWYFGEPSAYPALLEGKTIQRAEALGGLVKIYAEDTRIVLNDGVNLRLVPAGDKLPEKHQLLLGLEGGGSLVCTVQMYGGMMAYPHGAYSNPYYLAARQKPSPLTDAFTREVFQDIVQAGGPKLSLKALLATEQRIPGLGNGTAQDIFYHAGLNPQSKAGALEDSQWDDLYQSIKSILRAMADGGGRDTEKDLYGKAGGYATALSSRTLAYPCRKCGGGIQRKAYLGGNIYFCPHCQPVQK